MRKREAAAIFEFPDELLEEAPSPALTAELRKAVTRMDKRPEKIETVCFVVIMEKDRSLPFEVGQLAEAKSFLQGYRGAWFRCKIKQIRLREQRLSYLLEYYDFPDDKEKWIRVYQKRATGREYLMVRPRYPSLYNSSQIPAADSVSEVVVVADGTWKVGDLVDWKKDDCYWSGKVTRVFGNKKAEIELPPPPMGEGLSYKVPFEDLRPSLEWSPENGWLVPTCTVAGISSQCARLIQPVTQDSGEHSGRQMPTLGKTAAVDQASSGLPSAPNVAMTPPPASHESAIEKSEVKKEPLDCLLGKRAVENQAAPGLPSVPCDLAMRPPTAPRDSTTEKTEVAEEPLDDKSTIEPEMNSVAEGNSWSQGGVGIAEFAAQADEKHLPGSNFAMERFRSSGGIPLNSLESDTIEAAIIDLVEYLDKLRWLRRVAKATDFPSNSARSVWKFIEHRASSLPR